MDALRIFTNPKLADTLCPMLIHGGDACPVQRLKKIILKDNFFHPHKTLQSGKAHNFRHYNKFKGIIRCSSGRVEDDFLYAYIEEPPYTSYIDPITKERAPVHGHRNAVSKGSLWDEDTVRKNKSSQASDLPKNVSPETDTPAKQKQKRGRRRKRDLETTENEGENEVQIVNTDVVALDEHDDAEEQGSENDEEDEEEEEEDEDGMVEYEEEGEQEGVELTLEDIQKNKGCYPLVEGPKGKKPIPNPDPPLTTKQLWWNRRRPNDKDAVWSRWQNRTPTSDKAMASAMQAIGQIKLFGETPTVCEELIHRARRKIFKQERLQAEEKRRKEIGSMAYYKEWVKAWKKDTSLEAVQNHYEATGEDVSIQLMDMLSHQTQEEYRVMMGTDTRIQRDPLVMRASQEHKKMVYGGDPVYPTINYIRDPNEVIDYRGPNFHMPTPSVTQYLKDCGRMITQEQLDAILAKQEKDEEELLEDVVGEGIVGEAIDIGDKEDTEADEETESPVSNAEENTHDREGIKTSTF